MSETPRTLTVADVLAQPQARRDDHTEAMAALEKLSPGLQRAIRDDVRSDLEADGWHEDGDCDPCDLRHADAPDEDDDDTIGHTVGTINGSLTDWHDRAHGLTHYPSCTQEPCSLIHPALRAMPALHLTR